jgi:7,8-dihydroneopterin aldolase/epimerase/oxygenase
VEINLFYSLVFIDKIIVPMGLIHLEDMEFYAYHGCFREEQIAGNRFLVNLTLETGMDKASATDDITDTLNYQTAYGIVKREMSVKSHLLEHIARRILDTLFMKFPNLDSASVKVSKMNPPMGGSMRCVSVEMERKRE